jgi:hypothetical protein
MIFIYVPYKICRIKLKTFKNSKCMVIEEPPKLIGDLNTIEILRAIKV